MLLAACTGTTGGEPEGSTEAGNPDEGPVVAGEGLPAGRIIYTTASATLRAAASDKASSVRALAAGARLVVEGDSGVAGWYKVSIRGKSGYVRDSGLVRASTRFLGSLAHKATVENVGHAYHWGKAILPNASPTKATQGTCNGNCPTCTMGGTYGADCSGYVGVVFGLPKADTHPVSTGTLEQDNDQWVSVSRENAKFGDAFAYNDGGGHVVIYESGDAWGTPMVYEARGCAYGIVHNTHKLSSKYVGVRRL